MASVSSEMEMYTVYKSPSDAPGKLVVRRWHISPGVLRPGEVVYIGESLTQARAAIPLKFDTQMRPGLGDDPVILETWM